MQRWNAQLKCASEPTKAATKVAASGDQVRMAIRVIVARRMIAAPAPVHRSIR